MDGTLDEYSKRSREVSRKKKAVLFNLRKNFSRISNHTTR